VPTGADTEDDVVWADRKGLTVLDTCEKRYSCGRADPRGGGPTRL